MTGMSMDLLTVILMVVLAFICGYSAGHKFGRDEVRRNINNTIGSINQIFEHQAKKMEEVRKQIVDNKNNPKGFLELLNQIEENMKNFKAEETKKEKDGDE